MVAASLVSSKGPQLRDGGQDLRRELQGRKPIGVGGGDDVAAALEIGLNALVDVVVGLPADIGQGRADEGQQRAARRDENFRAQGPSTHGDMLQRV